LDTASEWQIRKSGLQASAVVGNNNKHFALAGAGSYHKRVDGVNPVTHSFFGLGELIRVTRDFFVKTGLKWSHLKEYTLVYWHKGFPFWHFTLVYWHKGFPFWCFTLVYWYKGSPLWRITLVLLGKWNPFR
jgi:hypothetical protein